jgi:hypothetical protein
LVANKIERVQIKSGLIPGTILAVVQIDRSGVLQQVALDRRRFAPMIVSALLGAVILTDATQVSSHVRTESSRSLVLTGIIAYTDPRQGFAIIGSSVQHTYLARPGQQLPDGSRILEIHPKHVVLEYGGSLEIVGMYERGQPAGAVYAQNTPLPQQRQREEAGLIGVTAADTTPSLVRPTDTLPGHPRPSDTRPNETPADEVRSNDALLPADAPPSDTPPKNALPRWAQPQAPLPAAQDPADEFSEYRRRRAESRGLFPRNSPAQTE